MITKNKSERLAFMIVCLACFGAIGVLFIVNFAVAGGVTWAAYPILSVVFAWAVAAPALLLSKGRIVAPFVVFSVLVVPYLYFIDVFTPGRSWFVPLGLPLAAVGVAAMWVSFFVVMKIKKHALYVSALLVFVWGVVAALVAEMLAEGFAGTERDFLSVFITPFVCLVAAFVLVIIGYAKRKK